MPEYIERVNYCKNICLCSEDLCEKEKCPIWRASTADVEPVRHGHWKKTKGNERPTENGFVHDDRYICDCCGWGCCCETELGFSFCPNCGAKMDGTH